MKKTLLFAASFLCVLLPAVPVMASSVTVHALTLGDRGTEVGALQRALAAQGLFSEPITGYFGPVTQAAVRTLQVRNGLEGVGVVGPKTRALLDLVSAPSHINFVSHVGRNANTVQTPPVATVVSGTREVSHVAPIPFKTKNFADWDGVWGRATSTISGSLRVMATASSTGAGAIYPGSLGWKDYEYTASVTIYRGDVTLYGRYVDGNNFAACVFSGNKVRALQRVNGVNKTLGTGTAPGRQAGSFFFESTNIALRVRGNSIGCSAVAGDNVVAALDQSLEKGGIGIETWYEHPGIAEVELTGVDVSAL